MVLLRSLSRACFGAVLLGTTLAALPGAGAAPLSAPQLQALQSALNGSDPAALRALLAPGPGLEPGELQARWLQIREQFPDARWALTTAAPLRSGQSTVSLRVTGTRVQGAASYRLTADQLLYLNSDGNRINGQTVLREQSILRSGDSDLPVSLLIPDAVLTGQRYDIDVIFDDPLDGAITAGGIVALTPQQVAAMESPSLELAALGGGGLFKTVQAPLSPGSQTWAVLLVHPKGVVSATKRVRVVADKAALKL